MGTEVMIVTNSGAVQGVQGFVSLNTNSPTIALYNLNTWKVCQNKQKLQNLILEVKIIKVSLIVSSILTIQRLGIEMERGFAGD